MKKRLLYIGNKLSKGNNTVTSIETLSGLLQKEGYVVIVASGFKNKAIRLLDMFWTTFIYRKHTTVVLIDTYSTQNFKYAVLVGRLCRVLKLPYIPILHGGNLPNRLVKSPGLSKQLFNGAMTNIAPSHYLLDAFKKEGFTKLSYIPNTIEIARYSFLFRSNIKPRLLWVRAFDSIYNPLLALKIVEELLDRNIDVSLCMVGPEKDGSLATCKELAVKKKLPISFTGLLSKEEWSTLSNDYDLFLNTTNFDNTPVSVLEAMALGLPVIATNVGGLPYLIDHDKTGVLVPPNDERAFVEEITELLSNPEKASFLAKNARAYVEQFDWSVVKKLWDEILRGASSE